MKTSRSLRIIFRVITVISIILASAPWTPVKAEGSKNLFPTASANRRALTEWRIDTTVNLYRRTFFRVYAQAGEYILMASSAMRVASSLGGGRMGDIALYQENLITNSQIDPATLAGITPTWTCSAHGAGAYGLISTRAQELQGPTRNGGADGGFTPCVYTVPAGGTGTYWVAMYGPDGPNANRDGDGGTIDVPVFTNAQNSGVSAWDITVRSGSANGTDKPGRVFVDYLAQLTGGNGAAYQQSSTIYAVTIDGYVYQIDLRGLDPFGYIFYGNRVGYLDPDGKTPLYHDVVTTNNQLSNPQGGVTLPPATAKIFFSNPLSAPDLPPSILPVPVMPSISNVYYQGSAGGNTGYRVIGGTFTYTGNVGGINEIIISRDGVDYSPDNPLNRRLLSQSVIGTNLMTWDGKDNSGNYFPVGNGFAYKVVFHAGEYHFPLLDAENSQLGGPTFTLLNPVGGTCPFNINCHTAFYDDRGYRVSTGVTVGTVGATLPGDVNAVNPPATNHSDQANGFDTSTNQRAWGDGTGNGFGNWKGLDLWTYFPASAVVNYLNVIDPVGPDLNILKSHTGMFNLGTNGGSFNLSISNVGTATITGLTTVTDTLPAGLTLNATPSGTGWTCNGAPGASSFTCTRNDDLATGAAFPVITVNTDVAIAAAPSATNTAMVANATDTNTSNNQSSDLILVAAPDLTVTKTHSPSGNATVGFPFNWVLTAANNGTMGATFTAGQTILRDPLPANVTYGAPTVGNNVNITNPGNINCAIAANVLTCTANGGPVTIGANNGSFQVTFSGTPTAAGALSNTATVDPNNNIVETNETNNTSTDAFTVVAAQADLAVTKTDGVTNIMSGDSTTYTLTLTNNGPAAANGATIRDQAAAGLTKTYTGDCSASGGAVCPVEGAGAGQLNIANLEAGTVIIPTLPSGGSISFLVTASVTAANGNVTNTFTATVPAGLTDPTPGNNSATDTDTIPACNTPIAIWTTNTQNPASGSGSMTASGGITLATANPAGWANNPVISAAGWPNAYNAGRYVQFAVSTSNFQNIWLQFAEERAPGLGPTTYGLYYSTNGGTTWTQLGANRTTNTGMTTVSFDLSGVAALNNNANAVFQLRAFAGTATRTWYLDDVTFTGCPQTDLSVTKTNGTTTVAAGGTTTYTLTATNNGPNAANNAFLFDPAAAGLSKTLLGACTASGGAACPAAGQLTIANLEAGTVLIPTFPSGGSISFTVTASVTATGGNVTNTFSISPPSGVVDTNSANDSASDTDAVVVLPTISKAFAAPNLAAGGNLNLTVTIGNGNTGPITLSSLLTDTLPVGMTINVGGNAGTCTAVTATSGAGSFSMANGTSIPVGGCTIVVNVTSNTAGTAVNTIPAGALQTSVGNNASAATASLNVYIPPTLTKTFGAGVLKAGTSTTLTLTLANPLANPGSLTGLRVDDTFPTGLTLQNTTFTFTPAACGSVTKISGQPSAAGDGVIRFSTPSLTAGSSCQAVMNVTSSTIGAITNTTSGPIATGPVFVTGGTASANLNVIAIDAVDDSGTTINGTAGGTSVANVLVNDTLNGAAATTSNVNLTAVGSWPSGITLNTSTGAVSVAAGTAYGTYTPQYQICDKANPTICDTANVNVPVVVVNAVNDSGTAINGTAGGTSVANVLSNDTLSGAAATTANVNLTVVGSWPSGITLNTSTGAVTVAAGTANGTYTPQYQICDKVNPTFCSTATVTVPVTVIQAKDDTGTAVNGTVGGTSINNVLANNGNGTDLLNGAAATTSTVNITAVGSWPSGVILNTSTGAVTVAAGTAYGTYTPQYQICDKANPTFCSTATVTVPVTVIQAKNDNGTTINGTTGGTSITDVLANNGNGTDLLNGVAATTSTVNITAVGSWPSGITLNTSTGAVTVAAGTAYGTYTPQYQICDKANPTFCSTATVNVPVVVVNAVNDSGTTINGTVGGTSVGNVLTNDTLNGSGATTANVNLTAVGSWPSGITLNTSTGAVTVAAGTASGTYTPQYQICDKANPTFCSTATVTVPVVVINAVNDTGSSINGTVGGTSVANVLSNDTLNGGTATTANVNLTTVGSWPAGVTLNTSTGAVTVAAGTASGTYTPQYQICDKSNPTFCSTATVTVPVSVIQAKNDNGTAVNGAVGGTSIPNVLADNGNGVDTLNGVAATTSTVTITAVGTWPSGITLNTSTGEVNVAPGTASGTYTPQYQICDQANPTYCSTATVNVPVYHTATIGHLVWLDVNHNGIQDSNEPGIEGVTVKLYASDGTTLVATTTSDINGAYSFTNVIPGSYLVEFDIHGGFSLTLQDQGADDSLDSDANPATGRTAVFSVTSGQTKGDVDAGYYTLSLDLGDLPQGLYDTLFKPGPAHLVFPLSGNTPQTTNGIPAVWLGLGVSTEPDGQPQAHAQKDTFDDGLSLAPSGWLPNQSSTATITVNASEHGTLVYYGYWIDWNHDGTFEYFTSGSKAAGSPATVTISVPVPSGYAANSDVFMRLRASDTPLVFANYDGTIVNGEVEDYWFQFDGGGNTTPVTVSYFLAQKQGANINFTWSTATESGNVGFNLYVKSGKKLIQVNPQLIPSKVIDSLERVDYTYSAAANGTVFYIEDVSVLGEATKYGPFQLETAYGSQTQADLIDWAAIRAEHNTKYAGQQAKLEGDMNVPPAALKRGTLTGMHPVVVTPKPTTTPTPTKKKTPTRTTTPTKKSTPTRTPKPSSTPTPKPTSTFAWTPTPTYTPTFIPTATPAWTPTYTVAPSAIDTPQPTDTPQPSATVEPAWTDTAEPSATDTLEPTPTQEPTATFTLEPSATDTLEPTATFTLEPSATNTLEPSATFTSEPSATFTPTLEPSATNTIEPTATAVPTATATPSEYATPVPADASKLLLTNTFNLKVKQTGLYRVTYEQLKTAGLDLAGVPATSITILNRGYMMPDYVYTPNADGTFGAGGYIEFYGDALDTLYTDTNIYTVQVSSQAVPQIPLMSAAPATGMVPAPWYIETVRVNNQLHYSTAGSSTDPWYDTAMQVSKTSKSWSFSLPVNGLADATAATTLSLNVWGYSASTVNPDHHLQVSLNGTTLADERFDGVVEHQVNILVPAGVVHEGTNTLLLTMPADTGATSDVIMLDRYSLSYPRNFQAQNGKLIFSASGEGFTVDALADGNVVVYRLRGNAIARLSDVQVQANGSSFSASLAGTDQPDKYLVSSGGAVYAPALEAVRMVGNLDQPAKYLIISHPDFISGLAPLIAAKQAQGLTVSVVNVNDLYAKYTYGIFDPQAIKIYIQYATQHLGTQYILLVGGDTYDYRNYLGKNSISFIPSMYTMTGPTAKFVPADPLYADVNGDNVPDVALGRFPVRSTTELTYMINKTLAYATKSYGKTSVFATDVNDGTDSFKTIGTGFAAEMPSGWSTTLINLDDVSLATAKANLIATMNGGTALVTYVGHSGPQQWGTSSLFGNADAAALTNVDKPFVVVMWGCWNTFYVDPIYNYLVQKFLFSGNQGAAAVMGATTLADAGSETALGNLLMPLLVTPGETLGQALRDAKLQLAQTQPGLVDVQLGITLMGDPALVIQP